MSEQDPPPPRDLIDALLPRTWTEEARAAWWQNANPRLVDRNPDTAWEDGDGFSVLDAALAEPS